MRLYNKRYKCTNFFRNFFTKRKEVFKIKKISEELEKFVDSIDQDTPEEIIMQVSKKTLEDPIQGLMTKINLTRFLEGATLADVSSTDKGLMMIFIKNGKVYGLDWMDGHGVTLSEYVRPGEWSFQS